MEKQPASKSKKGNAILGMLFGNLHWSKPVWVDYLNRRAVSHPKTVWSLMALFMVLLALACYSYVWYAMQPEPQYVTLSITSPNTNPPTDESSAPTPVVFNFGLQTDTLTNQPVAPLSLIGNEVTQGISLTPAIAGTWVWEKDSRLIFTPKGQWPAGQTYAVRFEKTAFTPTTKLKTYAYTFSTEAFQAHITAFTLYQDPVNPSVRQAVATVQFNFPVDATSLQQHTGLQLQRASQEPSDLKDTTYPLTITLDEHQRIAYVHSETIPLTNTPRYLTLTVGDKTHAITGANLTEPVSKNVLIPDIANYFSVNSAKASIIRNEQDKPEQILSVETSLGTTEKDLNKHLHVYLLPKNYPATVTEKEKPDYAWQNPGEISSAILALAEPLPLHALPSEHQVDTLHSYKLQVPANRYLYVQVDTGLHGFGDFTLNQPYAAVMETPEYPKEISFLHKGALLALNSEKRLSVVVRGLPAVKFSFARVLPDNVNQLVTQTQGDFNNPFFINQSFNQQNISEIFSEVQSFNRYDPAKPEYTALNFAKYLASAANANGPQGLFLLQATGWDVENNTPLDTRASRLILMTDLGLLVKDNNDSTHDVFVQSITQGGPVAGVSVAILGKNGIPILTRVTDEQGHASFPTFTDFIEDREPTVYLASLGSDVSFIPYNNASRQLNYTRYDVGGITQDNAAQSSLSAYLFSDRGLYKPGDTAQLAMIVKQMYVQPQPAGLPVELMITDPRGATIQDKKFTLNETGLLTTSFATTDTSPTGQYAANLYIVKDDHADSFLGSTTFRVAEFQPDRMRITSQLSQTAESGWISPDNLTAQVSLWNLYGAPAVNRKVNAKLLLTPQPIEWNDYPGYTFVDPLLDPRKPVKVFTDTLPEQTTDDKGQVRFNLNLDRFEKATYRLTFYAEGFEADSGRSVTTQTTAWVSPLAYFIGYKTDGDVQYITQHTARSVNYIAINPNLQQTAVGELTIQLASLHPVSTLVKKPDGTYQYQSIVQTKVINTAPFTVPDKGINYTLPTEQIGDFALSVVDKNNTALSQLKFSVVGEGHLPLAQNAELRVKLNKAEYQANENIALHLTAPYTGTGLITIEQDKVYATQWFKTTDTSSVQTIQIPSNFQGNGYINVAFVRDWESPEIFINPLSYAVVPFTVSHEDHAMQIQLDVPEKSKPGESFTMHYKTDKPGKIVVFAVDEGILQVSHYDTPDPLAFFFQKRALQVITQQTVDQILPKFIQARELSAVGGDGGEEALANHLNPFKRKTDLPVVYWSGIVDTDDTSHELVYQIPDYFNGTLRVMAVAVGSTTVGAAEKEATIQGDFVINPNVPTFVAPGDTFEISASIANNIKHSGPNAEVKITLQTTAGLELVGSNQSLLTIPENSEQTVRFSLRATSLLGSAKLTLQAQGKNTSSSMDATLSVRPATVFKTTIQSGQTDQRTLSLPLHRNLYPEYRQVEAALSSSPLILLLGLQQYLDNFPYGCTEQLVSKATPLLAMANQPWFKLEATAIQDKLSLLMQTLSARQMTNGSFSYWPGVGDNTNNTFASLYAIHFLTEAQDRHVVIPNDLLIKGVNYLKELVTQNVSTLEEVRLQAYAIYLLTRNEVVTSNYLTHLRIYLDQHPALPWQQDITSAYLAASFQLLKSSGEAEQLITQFKPKGPRATSTDFYSQYIADAQYLYLVALHFPDRLINVGNEVIPELVTAMNSGEINTVLSGYSSLALNAYAQTEQTTDKALFSLSATGSNNQEKSLASPTRYYVNSVVGEGLGSVTFHNPNAVTAFYQLTQAGFDTQPDTNAFSQGIEVFREYRSLAGDPITTVPLGEEVEVHLQLRATQDRLWYNVAVVDLLPGGFEVVRDSVKTDGVEYADVREDRVVFFLTATLQAQPIVYRIKAINPGQYQVPPVFAEAMYDPSIRSNGATSTIKVSRTGS